MIKGYRRHIGNGLADERLGGVENISYFSHLQPGPIIRLSLLDVGPLNPVEIAGGDIQTHLNVGIAVQIGRRRQSLHRAEAGNLRPDHQRERFGKNENLWFRRFHHRNVVNEDLIGEVESAEKYFLVVSLSSVRNLTANRCQVGQFNGK